VIQTKKCTMFQGGGGGYIGTVRSRFYEKEDPFYLNSETAYEQTVFWDDAVKGDNFSTENGGRWDLLTICENMLTVYNTKKKGKKGKR